MLQPSRLDRFAKVLLRHKLFEKHVQPLIQPHDFDRVVVRECKISSPRKLTFSAFLENPELAVDFTSDMVASRFTYYLHHAWRCLGMAGWRGGSHAA